MITPGERQAYDRARAGRLFRESDGMPEGTAQSPFVPLAGRDGWFRIRRRADGACGFLSAGNRCRIHEELGGDQKPLACRMFPFAVHAAEREVVMTASFACPTVVVNAGQPLTEQAGTLKALRGEWERVSGGEARPVLFAAGRVMSARALGALRAGLLRLLDVPGPDGCTPLGSNVRRIGLWVEDLSRSRVVRLPPDDLAEYVTLTGGYAAASERPVADRRPSRLSRLLARGLVFVTCASGAQQARGPAAGLQLGLRWRMIRLLLHAHGVGPATPDLDLSARRRLPLDADAVGPLVRHYLRASFETLGTGRWPVLDELSRAAAVLHVAFTLAAAHAARAGEARLGAVSFQEGLVRASDVTHVEGLADTIVGSLTAGPEAFFLLADCF